jgi:hypothetical protein
VPNIEKAPAYIMLKKTYRHEYEQKEVSPKMQQKYLDDIL